MTRRLKEGDWNKKLTRKGESLPENCAANYLRCSRQMAPPVFRILTNQSKIYIQCGESSWRINWDGLVNKFSRWAMLTQN